MKTLYDIAKAVAAEIAAAYTSAVVSTSLVPRMEVADIVGLTVTVVPTAVEIVNETRAVRRHDYTIDIGIQQKVTGPDSGLNTQIVAFATQVESISDYLARLTLSDYPSVQWISSTNEPAYIPAHLTNNRVLSSVLSVTYRGMRT